MHRKYKYSICKNQVENMVRSFFPQIVKLRCRSGLRIPSTTIIGFFPISTYAFSAYMAEKQTFQDK